MADEQIPGQMTVDECIADYETELREKALALQKLAIQIRCGGRSIHYQRDGEWGSFPADDVLELSAFVLLELGA